MVKNHFGVGCHVSITKHLSPFHLSQPKSLAVTRLVLLPVLCTAGVGRGFWTVIPNTGVFITVSHKTQKLLWTWNLPIVSHPEKPVHKWPSHKALLPSFFFLNE